MTRVRQQVLDIVFGRHREHLESEDETAPAKNFDFVERTWKLAGIAIGCLYVIGLLHWALYLNSLHVRALELVRIQYLLAGALCVVFVALHVVVVSRANKRWWTFWLCLLGVGSLLFMMNRHLRNALEHSLGGNIEVEDWFGVGLSSGQLLFLVMVPAAAYRIVRRYYKARRSQLSHSPWPIVAFLAPIFLCSYMLFFQYFFPNIPAFLGGGMAPTVRMYFNQAAPEDVQSAFDVSYVVRPPVGHKHYGTLIYAQGDRLFLQPAPWFDTTVYEMNIEYIDMLEYTSYNPVDRGSRRRRE